MTMKMQLRAEDIFPRSTKPEQILKELADLTQSALKGIFPANEDIIKYISNFKKPQKARLFLETGRYYHLAKNYSCPICFPPKRLEKCPNCRKTLEMPSFLVLIMIISIMERLSQGEKTYQEFYTWMGTKKARKKVQDFLEKDETKKADVLIEDLRECWLKEYGSTTRITEFFKNFLTKEEKIEVVKSIRYVFKVFELPPKSFDNSGGKKEIAEILDKWEEVVNKKQEISFQSDQDIFDYIEKNDNKKTYKVLPICFNEERFLECYSRDIYGRGKGYCNYNHLCKLGKDSKILNDCFVQTVKTIYDWRSKFVHNMKIPPIRETSMVSDSYDNKLVLVELTTKSLKPVFERMIKRYFDQFQK
ncbi:MAG: hypothetical protein NWF04_01425 [Candidatus Bathyarchaeota archaeon]|nr:hypothetical protein [Candidatus Bathyarchaeota archaeon]